MDIQHEPEKGMHSHYAQFITVTPFSKYLAMVLFILLPFIGGWVGYSIAVDTTAVQSVTDETGRLIEETVGETEVFAEQQEIEIPAQFVFHNEDSVYTFTTSQGRESQSLIMSTLEFEYNDIPGKILHTCDGYITTGAGTGSLLQALQSGAMTLRSRFPLFNTTSREIGSICYGTNRIIIQWNDKDILVSETQTSFEGRLSAPDHQVFNLNSYTFAEGGFGDSATTSNKDPAILIIITDRFPCYLHDGVCFNTLQLAHFVELPSGRVLDYAPPQEGAIAAWGGHTKSLLWNLSGTKALFAVPCPAGCPPVVLEMYDMQTGQVATVLSEESKTPDTSGHMRLLFDLRDKASRARWLDDNTVEIDDEIFNF